MINRFKLLRITKGLKQQELARKIGKYQQWISRIENGQKKISERDLYKLNEALIEKDAKWMD
ncbi:MAG: helix-turn-helix domain-containing protein [Planctomycetota bacterium]